MIIGDIANGCHVVVFTTITDTTVITVANISREEVIILILSTATVDTWMRGTFAGACGIGAEPLPFPPRNDYTPTRDETELMVKRIFYVYRPHQDQRIIITATAGSCLSAISIGALASWVYPPLGHLAPHLSRGVHAILAVLISASLPFHSRRGLRRPRRCHLSKVTFW